MIYFGLLVGLLPAAAQSPQADLFNFIREKHGFNQELINGIQYYYPYSRSLRHPYFGDMVAREGCLVLSGTRYNNLQILYDIYNQFLVLEYKDEVLGFRKIIIDPVHIDAFKLDGFDFRKLALDENGPLFYQVIRVNGMTCYIHWTKDLLPQPNDLRHPNRFTDPARTYTLEFNSGRYPFSNRRNFGSLFDDNERRKIRKYMRVNRIRFKDVPISKLTALLEFIASVNQTGPGN